MVSFVAIQAIQCSALPWLIDRASKGDWAPIVKEILEDERDADNDLSLGLLLSITCSDDVPFVRQGEVAAATRNTFLGDWRLRQQQAACKAWPHSVAPASYREPIHTRVPTMFVSGDPMVVRLSGSLSTQRPGFETVSQ
jgi:hypothetical protein